MSTNEHPREPHPDAPGERPIHMWERVERDGKVYYVPLGKDLQPISDIALQDVATVPHYAVNASEDFLLIRGIGTGTRTGGLDQESLDHLVIGAIQQILEEGDATTYQICEALVRRLNSSDFSEGVSVDVAGLLHDNFWNYEAPSAGGYMIKKWTLDQERAKAHWKAQKKKLQPGPLMFPQTNLYN